MSAPRGVERSPSCSGTDRTSHEEGPWLRFSAGYLALISGCNDFQHQYSLMGQGQEQFSLRTSLSRWLLFAIQDPMSNGLA
jgi:hypothetical protein